MDKMIICLIVIIVLIFIGILFILFTQNRFKTKKLFGGIGCITEYGSTINLEPSGLVPLVDPFRYGIPIKDNLKTECINELTSIAKNPITYIYNLGIKLNNKNIPRNKNYTKLLTHPFYYCFRNCFPEIYEQLVTNNYSDKNPLVINDILNQIFIFPENCLTTIMNNIETVRRYLTDKMSIKPKTISQGNTNTYKYLIDSNTGLSKYINIPFNSGDDFRRWFQSSSPDGFDYMKVEDRNNILYLGKDKNITGYAIADIFPASENTRMAYYLYTILTLLNDPDNIKNNKRDIKLTVAMHILMCYLINIAAHFVHDPGYNSSIKNNYTFN